MRLKFASLMAGALLFAAVPAFAGTVNFCTGAPSSKTDEGKTLTSGGVTATGWQGTSTSSMNAATDLSCKNQGLNEDGLGIFSDPDGEIGTTNFVQLAGLSGSVTLNIQSVQSGEGFDIFASNSNGVLGTSLLGSGNGSGGATQNVTFTLNASRFAYLDVTATSANVLIGTSTSPTPEPSTYLLMGTGLLMLGFFLRRKYASASC